MRGMRSRLWVMDNVGGKGRCSPAGWWVSGSGMAVGLVDEMSKRALRLPAGLSSIASEGVARSNRWQTNAL